MNGSFKKYHINTPTMPSIDIVSFFQTVLSLTIATFPVIDTDEKKLLVWEALEPVLDLFLDSDNKFYNRPSTSKNRVLRNFESFLELIKIDTITIDLLLKRIENQLNEIKKHYDEECDDARLWYCCEKCSSFYVPIGAILQDIAYWRSCEKEESYGYDYPYIDSNEVDEYEPDFDKVKNTLIDDRDKNNHSRAKRDIPRHQRNKGILPMKKKSTQQKQKIPAMKSKRYVVGDFSL